ncbi:MAG TPA: SUMF1/EgtB/PvdO family nonheme iron enzyme [Candidatus Cloacimonadota bacterium]|nr:SUMF1/EgtB/PvdO family nonheme iron enzyme [Candidatus Cloacimonadota bacterium]HPS38408.1 SUMF1/EgtB/PvdO family nonheme iron enzyme [Candidatus Cloacimonadota bacterium]
MAHFCINCGKEIPSKAKYCPFCGEFNELEKLTETETVVPAQAEKAAPQADQASIAHTEDANSIFTILEPGSLFQGYTIVQLQNKDPEGFKYIAEKKGKKYLLKIFYQSSFSSMDHLYQQQMRLSRIAKIKDAHTARVVEVNLVNNPSFMAAEYVQGRSLAQIKSQKPDEPQEDFICKHIPALIKTAEHIRKQGLTISNLNLHGVMLDEHDNLVILSSGIDYENVDEREDVFAIGVIIAQFLATNGLYKTVYNLERLRSQKFSYIHGVTLSLNKLLADCLHRNILQRVTSLNSLLKAFEALPEINEDSVWISKDKPKAIALEGEMNAPKPASRYEIGFILLIVGIIAAIILTVILVFGRKIAESVGIDKPITEDSLSLRTVVVKDTLGRGGEAVDTGYGRFKQLPDSETSSGSSGVYAPTGQASSRPVSHSVPMPANMVRIDKGSVALGRLDEKAGIVPVSTFYISKYELTQAEWNKYKPAANVTTVGDRNPVDYVTWMEAIEYCNKRSDDEGLERAYLIVGNTVSCNFNKNGYRLPTEAEWEYAAKSGMSTSYSGSSEPEEVAWFNTNSASKLHSVGQKAANGFGLYDMSGNVSEWIWDWYDSSLNITSVLNPTGPKSGTTKVVRGGNAISGEGRSLSLVNRESRNPMKRFPFVGFRLVRSY